MPTSEVPSAEVSDANLQPTCSSSSSGITCTHADIDSDNLNADDDASSDKEIEASSSLATAWTDSKHSSYLNFMEQNFVRDLYEREYCALDVCGQPCQRLRHIVEEAQDPNSAESPFPTPFGPMEFKVWENGNWTWRLDSKRKVHPCNLLSNPWFKHFRRQASPGSDISNISNTTVLRNGQDVPQILCGNPGSREIEVSSSVYRGDNDLEAKHGSNQPSVHGDSRLRKRNAHNFNSEYGSTMRRGAPIVLDKGGMTIGVLREVCKGGGDGVDSHYHYSCVQHSGDG